MGRRIQFLSLPRCGWYRYQVVPAIRLARDFFRGRVVRGEKSAQVRMVRYLQKRNQGAILTRHTSPDRNATQPTSQRATSQRGRSSFTGKGDTLARDRAGRGVDARTGAARSASSSRRAAGRGAAGHSDTRGGRASRQGSGRGGASSALAAAGRALAAAGRAIVSFLMACVQALGAVVQFVADLVASRRGTLRRRPQGLELRHIATLALLAVVIAVPVSIVNSCNARHAEEQRAAAQLAQSKQDARELATLIPQAAKRVAQASIEPTSTPRDQWQKGTMPYLYQIDPQYRDEQYSNGSMRLQGCGPFALDMVYIHLTGDTSMGPVEMAAYSTKNGYSTDRNGSAWALIGNGAAGLGLKSQSIATSASALKAALEAGNDVICIMGPGTFTRVGHFIAIEGLDADGRAIVHDSNSYGRSHMTWDLSLIASEARNAWSLSV